MGSGHFDGLAGVEYKRIALGHIGGLLRHEFFERLHHFDDRLGRDGAGGPCCLSGGLWLGGSAWGCGVVREGQPGAHGENDDKSNT